MGRAWRIKNLFRVLNAWYGRSLYINITCLSSQRHAVPRHDGVTYLYLEMHVNWKHGEGSRVPYLKISWLSASVSRYQVDLILVMIQCASWVPHRPQLTLVACCIWIWVIHRSWWSGPTKKNIRNRTSECNPIVGLPINLGQSHVGSLCWHIAWCHTMA